MVVNPAYDQRAMLGQQRDQINIEVTGLVSDAGGRNWSEGQFKGDPKSRERLQGLFDTCNSTSFRLDVQER